MKKSILFLAIISLLLFSCKKEIIKTEVVTKTIYVHDSTIVTQTGDTVVIIIHDTVYITTSPPALLGQWNITLWTQTQNGVLVSTTNAPGYIWTFTPTDCIQHLESNTYTYPITYSFGYVTMTQLSSPYDYTYSYDFTKEEYIFVKTKVSGSVTTISKYYLHK